LDIEGAYDNVSTGAMMAGMREHHFPLEVMNWYEFYLKNRSCEFKSGGSLVKRFLRKGTPHGGILSPVMFNLAMDGLLKICEAAKILGIGFLIMVLRRKKGRILRQLYLNCSRC
jgi:hypothetical protein